MISTHRTCRRCGDVFEVRVHLRSDPATQTAQAIDAEIDVAHAQARVEIRRMAAQHGKFCRAKEVTA